MSEARDGLDRRQAIALGGAAVLPLGVSIPANAVLAMKGLVPFGGRDQPFDDGWLFHRGAGEGLEAPGLDDSGWRKVDLPHDWSVEDIPGSDPASPFDQKAIGGTATGYTVGGEGWYRKHIRWDMPDSGPLHPNLEVCFDGVMVESDIWLNGHHLTTNLAGYKPFTVDLTPYFDIAGDNVLAVRVRNNGQNSRWYAGSGIYRQVTLNQFPSKARIAHWGVGASTRRIAGGAAHIEVTTKLEDVAPGCKLLTSLTDSNGLRVASQTSPAQSDNAQHLSVPGAKLWSPDHPHLYSLETELVDAAGKVIDQMSQLFGIRIVTMDPQRGLAINGVRTTLRGGCIHHDNGLLGACAYPEADERRIRLLKARGYNAIRSSHNIPSRSLRTACDKLGMLLIAEGFDAWHWEKLPQDFHKDFGTHWREVLDALVLSGRNSPSIIMWSIGNEIPNRNSDEGVEWQWKLANHVRTLDPTRPVTEALNGILGGPMVAGEGTARRGQASKVDNASSIFLDVPGYNYRLNTMESEHADHPERVVYASETFPHDVVDYTRLARRAPWFLGEFVWTSMDYIGEAGVGATTALKGNVPYYITTWPWVNAWCGDLDLTGAQKPPSLARDVAWGLSAIEVMVQRPLADGMHDYVAMWGWPDEMSHWNWEGHEGKPMAVRVYTSGGRVELYLNGKKVGEKMVRLEDKMKVELPVPYAAGVLEALVYNGGRLIARRRLETVGAPVALRLTPERPHIGSGRQSLAYVRLDVVDARGRRVPEARLKVSLEISGPAELAGFGSADPQATRSLQQPTTETFRGSALAILRAHGAGLVHVLAHADGMRSAGAELQLL
ncbi:MAG: DUF4982 domain-containing protein [Alphaproteobacteria bacterium]|nr:DUF4982 domain-containing protein [Alphaproteobacteria bacterium]